MHADTIYKNAARLIRKSGSRDPFTIAKDNGILLLFNDTLDKLKGIYTVIKKNRVIIINSNLMEEKQKIVCAHELGHDLFHRELAKDGALQEFMLYDMTGRPEYEANMFAAELLLDDDEISSLAKDGYDMQQIAKILHTDVNLVGLKMASMNYRGHDLRIGIQPQNNFLKE